MELRMPILLFLLLTTGYLQAQNTVVLRFVESTMKKLSFLQVVYDDGRSDSIELDSWGGAMSTTAASASKSMKGNQMVLAQTMSKLESEGYSLTHMSSSGGDGIMTTFMIFKREGDR